MKLWEKIQLYTREALFPSNCVSCAKPLIDKFICNTCYQTIPIYNSFFCSACGQRAPDFKKCSRCQNKSHLQSIGFAVPYTNVSIQKLVRHLKYYFIIGAADPLANIILDYLNKSRALEKFKKEDSIIIPIPLHPKRLTWRGFNQSEKIAKILSQKIEIPLYIDILARVKNNKPQVEMPNFENRHANISGAFAINKNFAPKSELFKKNVLLLDDVITSGTTIEEAALTLGQAGFRKIYGLAVAKG